MSRILLSPSQYVQGKGELARLAQYILPLGQKPFVLISASGQNDSVNPLSAALMAPLPLKFSKGNAVRLKSIV